MNAKNTIMYLCVGLSSIVVSYTITAAEIFSDSFDETIDMSKTNSGGFKWAKNNRTSIVTQDPIDGSVAVYNNKIIYNINSPKLPDGTIRNWNAKTGLYSLRFYYPAGVAMSEQRFDLGLPRKNVWISFWLRVPDNFSYGPTGSPNKFFSLWSDGYSAKGDGSTVWLGFHRTNGADSTISITYSNGGFTSSNRYQQAKPFIKTSDRGRWMRVVMHFKTESSPGASDGIIETFRKWDGDNAYTKLHEAFNLPIKTPGSGPNGFKSGYILGWANAAYQQDTEWLLDDFVVSDSSPTNIIAGKLPSPPSGLIIQ